ncbi:MFS transporter permease [Paracoccus sp. (in: a-proteobacteria)]|uniref:MFS transporter permease n=1 Tax=Paracoccus sp. TaxID=267 RepID=UPI00396C8D3E
MGLTITSVMQLGISGLPRTSAGAGAIQMMYQVEMAASVALGFSAYDHALAMQPAVEAVAAMLWLQIIATGAATLRAAGQERGRSSN